MWPAYPLYAVIVYFLLALLAPAGWALWSVRRRARVARRLICPNTGAPTQVTLDPWYAVRMHARGDNEFRVLDCARWPDQRDCGRECLARAGRTV